MILDRETADMRHVTEMFLVFLRKQNLGHLADQYVAQLKARAESSKHRVTFVNSFGVKV